MSTKYLRITVVILFVLAALVLLVTAVESCNWRYVHDSPLMLYAGFLMDRYGAVPYRDFFDMNMPGTYWVMWVEGRVFGWSDLAFRAFDLLWLTVLCALTFLWIRPFGRLSAIFAFMAFPLWYLLAGPSMSLQREYMALLPFASVLVISCAGLNASPQVRCFCAGVLAAATVLIKPQFLFLSLPALIFLMRQIKAQQVNIARPVIFLFVGLLVPCGATLLYLLLTHSLQAFLDISLNYWPLYTHMTGSHSPISGVDRWFYIAESTFKGLWTLYLPMALLGLFALSRDSTMNNRFMLVAAMLLLSAIYPAFSGQFWSYHWIPFQYVALCASSLSIRSLQNERVALPSLLPLSTGVFLLCSLCALCAHQADAMIRPAVNQYETRPLKLGVPDEIHDFLRTNMREGDTVQPLDWTGGAVHGMLLARARLATRFMYDFHFYHHISSPYIQKLRREFMNELSESKPRFIIEVLENKPWPQGPDTTREFPELQLYLQQRYHAVQIGQTYRIHERN
jgi:hypothetical protein